MLHFCRAGGGVPVFQVDSDAELLGCEQMCLLAVQDAVQPSATGARFAQPAPSCPASDPA